MEVTDTASVMLWTFGKQEDRISLGRRPESCVLVVVRGRDELCEYRFPDVSALRVFQADMEAFLHRTGWRLLEYSPERRRLHDRRSFPRLEERRRWWTDPEERAKVVWGDKPALA